MIGHNVNLNDILDLDAISQATTTWRSSDAWELTVPVLPVTHTDMHVSLVSFLMTHTDDAWRMEVSDYVQTALEERVTTLV